MGAVRVAEQEPHTHALGGLARQQRVHAGVVGEEQAAVDEDADLLLGRAEQVAPAVPGHRPAVRVDGEDLALRRIRHIGRGQRVGPQVGLVGLQVSRDEVAVPPVGDAPADPPLDCLRVHARRVGQLGRGDTALQQRRAQSLVRHPPP